jgi:hypothetical protein
MYKNCINLPTPINYENQEHFVNELIKILEGILRLTKIGTLA